MGAENKSQRMDLEVQIQNTEHTWILINHFLSELEAKTNLNIYFKNLRLHRFANSELRFQENRIQNNSNKSSCC